MSPSLSQEPGARLAPPELRRIIFGLMMAMLLGALDQTIVATAMPTIGRELGDADHLPWIVTAYLLSATSAVPLYGALADIYGRRIVLLSAIAIFVGGSLLCALAPSMTLLIVARFVQGIGGGGLLALSQTIIGDILTPRERAGYQGYFSLAFTTASLAGPVLGGFLAEHATWSMIFWINLPLGFCALAMTYGPLRRLPRHERPRRLDAFGAVLLVSAVSTLLLALSWAGPRYGWGATRTLGLGGGSLALFVVFGLWLRNVAEPLIPRDILASRVVRTATLAATICIGFTLGLSIYTPILFETVRGLSAAQSGIALLPLMVGTVGGVMISGKAMARLTHYKRVPLAAMPCVAIAALVLAFRFENLSLPALSLLLAVVSLAYGTLLPVSTVSIQNAVPLHQLGTATATANLCRQLGGAVAVAVFGAILLGSDASGAVRAGAHDPALLSAFRVLFVLVAVGAVVGFLAMLRLEERPLMGTHRPPEPLTVE